MFVGTARIDRDPKRLARATALQTPAAEDRAVGHRQEAGIAQDADLLAVAEATPTLACAAGIRRERQGLDPQGKSRLAELDRQVLRVRHDVNGVRPVSPGPPARAAAEDLAHQIRLAVRVESVKAGVADGLLVGRHAAARRLGKHASQDAEQPQDYEGPRVHGCREDRRQQRARRRKAQLDQRHDAFVHVQLGHAFGRVGQVAQDWRQPLLEKNTVRVIAGVIDGTSGLRSRAGEIDDQPPT